MQLAPFTQFLPTLDLQNNRYVASRTSTILQSRKEQKRRRPNEQSEDVMAAKLHKCKIARQRYDILYR